MLDVFDTCIIVECEDVAKSLRAVGVRADVFAADVVLAIHDDVMESFFGHAAILALRSERADVKALQSLRAAVAKIDPLVTSIDWRQFPGTEFRAPESLAPENVLTWLWTLPDPYENAPPPNGQLNGVHYDSDAPSLDDAPEHVPNRLLRVPGFIGDVIDYTLATAPYPDLSLAFCGAACLLSTLTGRVVADDSDLRTNIYAINLANSGTGKDHARKVASRILTECGLSETIGGAIASGQGIEDRMLACPVGLFLVDEFDAMIEKIAKTSEHLSDQIMPMLLQFYSSSNSMYISRAKAGGARIEVHQPHLVLFGTAIPKLFYSTLTSRMMANGFLARMIILECGQRGRGRDVMDKPVPSPIVATAARWAERRFVGGNLAFLHPKPEVVPMSSEARVILAKLRDDSDDRYDAARLDDDPCAMAVWARVAENARKLALLWACSVSDRRPRIEVDGARWACEFTRLLAERSLWMARAHAPESAFDGRRKRFLECLTKWKTKNGDEWMPSWKLRRLLPGWTDKDVAEVKMGLIEQELIECFQDRRGGRPGAYYRIR